MGKVEAMDIIDEITTPLENKLLRDHNDALKALVDSYKTLCDAYEAQIGSLKELIKVMEDEKQPELQ